MARGGQEFFNELLCIHLEAGGIDTGVAAEVLQMCIRDRGETALSGVEKFIAELEDAALSALWEKVRREE